MACAYSADSVFLHKGWYDAAEITQAAIGLMYHIHKDTFPPENVLFHNSVGRPVTIRAALCHLSGQIERPAKGVDYKQYLALADCSGVGWSKSNIMRDYSMTVIKAQPNSHGFHYNRMVYQVLASHFSVDGKNIIQCFGEWFGAKVGTSWFWEACGASSEPLGVRGLYMSEFAGRLFARKARECFISSAAFIDKQKHELSPEDFHPFRATHFWNGWFFVDHYVVAYGYPLQVISLSLVDHTYYIRLHVSHEESGELEPPPGGVLQRPVADRHPPRRPVCCALM
jgi:hypothetical protein